MDKRTKKNLSDEALMLRMRKYCALRERSYKEIHKKLSELGILDDKAPIIIKKLEQEGFLNEKRYAEAYARGKFRNKKWGKRKIETELKKQGIGEELLQKGLQEINQADYIQVLDNLLAKKWKQIQAKPIGETYISDDLFSPAVQKLLTYAIQKGFEYEVVMQRIKEML